MKLKISKQNQKLVKNFKKIVVKNREIEDRLFAALASKMMLTSSEEEILFAIEMAKSGQKMSTTSPQDASQEYLQNNLPK